LHPSGPHSRHHSGVSLGPPCGCRATLPGREVRFSPSREDCRGQGATRVVDRHSAIPPRSAHVHIGCADGAQNVRADQEEAVGTVVRFGNRVGGGDGGGARGCADRVERGDALDAHLVVADWALHDGLGGSKVRHLPLEDLGQAVFNGSLLGVVAGKDLCC
jgi:hypothetical protein